MNLTRFVEKQNGNLNLIIYVNNNLTQLITLDIQEYIETVLRGQKDFIQLLVLLNWIDKGCRKPFLNF